MHVEERMNEGQLVFHSKKAKTKNVICERQNGTGKQKCPEDISSRNLWLIIYGERANMNTHALGYSLLGLSRHGIMLHAVFQPWCSVQHYISP